MLNPEYIRQVASSPGCLEGEEKNGLVHTACTCQIFSYFFRIHTNKLILPRPHPSFGSIRGRAPTAHYVILYDLWNNLRTSLQ